MTKERSQHSVRYFLALILVNLMWAFLYPGAKIATQKLGPIAVALLPMTVATVLLSPFVVFSQYKRGGATSPGRASFGRRLLNFVILGTFGSVIAQLCLTSGVKRSLASNASVITLTIPVLTAFLATILLGERMNRLLWVSFALAVGGILMVSDVDWRSVQIFRGKYLAGNALIFAGCFGSAFYNAFSKRLLREFTPLEVLVYSLMVADVALFFLMLAREPLSWQQLASLGFAVWLSLGIIAVFSHASAMVLFFWVIKRIDLTQASLSIYLLPLFGVLLSTVTLKEKVTWQLLAGGVLVFIGTFLATTYGEGRRARAANA